MSEWISVKIGLPVIFFNSSRELLVFTNDYDYFLAKYVRDKDGDKYRWRSTETNDVLDGVIAWMPLPDKYVMRNFDYE